MTEVINVQLLDFKEIKGKEFVTQNEDGSYTIFINARLGYLAQQDAYQHALKHIENDDFEKTDVQQIEAVAHGVADPDERPVSAKVFEARLKRLRRERARIKREMEEYERMLTYMPSVSDEEALGRLRGSWLYGGL